MRNHNKFFPIVKYRVKVYTPDSHVRSDYELTVRIKGQGKQKTADHVLYETTQVRERYVILSFVSLRIQGPGEHVIVTGSFSLFQMFVVYVA